MFSCPTAVSDKTVIDPKGLESKWYGLTAQKAESYRIPDFNILDARHSAFISS